jgi:hypothetical protein
MGWDSAGKGGDLQEKNQAKHKKINQITKHQRSVMALQGPR